MNISELTWNDVNIEHIARHDISPEEVEDICFGLHIAYRGRQLRYVLYGRTSSGRYLMVVLARRQGGSHRPVTARDMTDAEKRAYRRKFIH